MWARGWLVVLPLAAAGCGGPNNPQSFDANDLVQACTVLHSCMSGFGISECISLLYQGGTPAQVDCVLSASVASCGAATACIGARSAPDTNCTNRCLDDHTLVQCYGASMHTEIDCAEYPLSEGPLCVTGAGRVACGVGTCTTEGERSCQGAVHHACASGIETATDCDNYILDVACDATSDRACVPPSAGACTNQYGCDGDFSLYCDSLLAQQFRVDCKTVVPDGTCVTIDNFSACGWGTQCNPSTTPDMCLGTTLRTCVYGEIKDINCTTIGGTTCAPSTGAPGATCVP